MLVQKFFSWACRTKAFGTVGIAIGGACFAGQFATACGDSDGSLRASFNQLVEASRDCAGDLDCVLVQPGCPLSCTVSVHKQHEAAVKAKADMLRNEYAASGGVCAYDCRPATPLCQDNKCTALSAP